MIGASEYSTKLLTAFASGSGPDLFNQSSTLVAQYYNARILAPIDYAAMGYADEKALTGQYLTGFDGIRFAGKLYGVPTEVSNYACYLNNTLWKAAGLDPEPRLSQDLGGDAGGRREAHRARCQWRAPPPRLRFRLAERPGLLADPQLH